MDFNCATASGVNVMAAFLGRSLERRGFVAESDDVAGEGDLTDTDFCASPSLRLIEDGCEVEEDAAAFFVLNGASAAMDVSGTPALRGGGKLSGRV